MPDITMCMADCPDSKTCKRHPDSGTKPHEYLQVWCYKNQFDVCGAKDCEIYLPVNKDNHPCNTPKA